MLSRGPLALIVPTGGMALCLSLAAWFLLSHRRRLSSEEASWWRRITDGPLRFLTWGPARVVLSLRYWGLFHLVSGIATAGLAAVFWACFVAQIVVALRGELRRSWQAPPDATVLLVLELVIIVLVVIGALARRSA